MFTVDLPFSIPKIDELSSSKSINDLRVLVVDNDCASRIYMTSILDKMCIRDRTERDLSSRARVCVIGQTIVDNLFPEGDAVGKTLRINKAPFQVIGVLEAKGQSAGGCLLYTSPVKLLPKIMLFITPFM